MNKLIGKENREKLIQLDFIEVQALAYIRGWNIDNTILIFEEAQNSTPNQMKLLLTRIGFNSKFFISGDLEQTDRYKDKNSESSSSFILIEYFPFQKISLIINLLCIFPGKYYHNTLSN